MLRGVPNPWIVSFPWAGHAAAVVATYVHACTLSQWHGGIMMMPRHGSGAPPAVADHWYHNGNSGASPYCMVLNHLTPLVNLQEAGQVGCLHWRQTLWPAIDQSIKSGSNSAVKPHVPQCTINRWSHQYCQ